ncbi:ATP synthase F0, A subunit [Planctopirus limnophila DSM 3776]|uniref:ATP synthase subunit a n=1 Tax=Planctopirus limnophila (strain ATCC 43296 / DSM 3776 / IFAM 1008 / Mu 290) TaxID=521674 RepID=D5SN95_PLAL2|nr:F0F1 ATP synthase subunit A [Planctopirus limnophila]ADG66022.1 ATP synthase F0, A subunit [Planctopirus limnophila DSM 3776]
MSADHNDYFHHISDALEFEMPEFVYSFIDRGYFHLPKIFSFQITKFMVMQVLAAVLVYLIFRGLAKQVANGEPARGRWWNFWETLAVFVRDEVVRSSISEPHAHHDDHGHGQTHAQANYHAQAYVDAGQTHVHGHVQPQLAAVGGHVMATSIDESKDLASTGTHYADRFLPFIWSLFFYILFCNLLGAFPLFGTATASTSVTGVLALSVLVVTIGAGIKQSGAVGFWKSLVPSMDIPGIIGPPLKALIFVIELAGLFIKHTVLAIRLFANMLAGHVVIAVFLSFIAATANSGILWYAVTPASIFGQLAIGALELFVAFLQAYVFSLLASLFIGAAVNPH